MPSNKINNLRIFPFATVKEPDNYLAISTKLAHLNWVERHLSKRLKFCWSDSSTKVK
jgi:hypothetical protein